MNETIFLNTGGSEFEEIITPPAIYVDKTGLLIQLNRCLDTPDKLWLISRPRRFGKSYAAAMLNAYYQIGVENAEMMFATRDIASMVPIEKGRVNEDKGWKDFLGKYNVIYINIAGFVTRAKGKQTVMDKQCDAECKPYVKLNWINYLIDLISQDVATLYGKELVGDDIISTLKNMVSSTGKKIIWICDEWDLFFREEPPDKNACKDYIELLRGLFKDNKQIMTKVIAGAYMTGIMPMCKIEGQSAVSEFKNYSMIKPQFLAPYIGFTSQEVLNLCRLYDGDYELMKLWYDGYSFPGADEVYNPHAVIEALKSQDYASYWSGSSSYKVLEKRLNQPISGLRKAVLQMLAGDSIVIDTNKFTNIIEPTTNINDELTLLTHLGYLSYDVKKKSVRIPNREIREEFLRDLIPNDYTTVSEILIESDQLIGATWNCDASVVAKSIEAIHQIETDPLHYNNERDLSAVVRAAYLKALDYYERFLELVSGDGYIDIAFYPKVGIVKPPLLIELKAGRSSKAALRQIFDKHYTSAFHSYHGEILLVGINYSKKTKKHTCSIEKIVK